MWLTQHLPLRAVMKPKREPVGLEPLRVAALFTSFTFHVVGSFLGLLAFLTEVVPRILDRRRADEVEKLADPTKLVPRRSILLSGISDML